jgi:hypothetical protein
MLLLKRCLLPLALYQLRLNRRRRLTGTWQEWTSRRDKMWLKQKED